MMSRTSVTLRRTLGDRRLYLLLAGLLFFGEALTPGKVLGALLVIAGVVLFAFADGKEEGK